MDEKRTFKDYIKENKRKIVKRTLIVVGVLVGGVILKQLITGDGFVIERITSLPDESPVYDVISEAVDIASDSVA